MSEINLTPSEKRLLQLVAAGKSNKAIADRLHRTQNSVGVSLSRIYSKVGIPQDSNARILCSLRKHSLF